MAAILVENMNEEKLIYHYCSNETFAKIVGSKELWMCDILKSNDYEEMKLLLPSIYNLVYELYLEKPFTLKYNGLEGAKALSCLIEESRIIIYNEIENGEFTNYVTCFCEDGDTLGQWRGYANDGKGVSIGFSVDALHDMCDKSNGVLKLERIEYKSKKEKELIIRNNAIEILSTLDGFREWIIKNMTHNDNDDHTDGLLFFNFHSWIEQAVIESLKYKDCLFKEENEWRMFFANNTVKNADWIIGKENYITGLGRLKETVHELNNKTSFIIKEDDILAYYPFDFSHNANVIIKKLIIGPKNRSSIVDLNLFLACNNIWGCKISNSDITYR